MNDYYYPSSVGEKDHYFKLSSRKTGHYLEGAVTIAPEKIPLWLTLSTYFWGADKKPSNDKNAYSSYAEIGYSYSFNENNVASLAVGAALNKGFYTDYEHGFNVVNITAKYATNFKFGKFRLPVSASYVLNPYRNKSYVTLLFQQQATMSTAVILAARKERESEIPYPLRTFVTRGSISNLLDRTLSILSELHYEHIYIVVGYKKELFEKYRKDNVTLVYNKDYAFTSSMGSLSVVEPYINEDFVLIESDTFYEKKVLEQLTETKYDTCFSVTEESGSGDEAFVQTKNGFIEKVCKDRHQILHIDGEMIGLTKISLAKLHDMCRLYESASNKKVNYEYLLLDTTREIDRPSIRFRNLIWGEVDNEKDFHNLHDVIYRRLQRKENPYDRENLYSHLRSIFPDEKIDDSWMIEQIGGMSNKNFKVTTPSGVEYVLRVPGFGAEGMVERSNEDVNSMLACKMGLSPDIVYFNDETGIKLTAFVHNAETLNSGTIQRMDNMKQIANIFKKLHHSKVRFANEFNIFHEIVKYEHLLAKTDGKMHEGYESVRERVMGLEAYLNELGVEICPTHNDLVPENLLRDENNKVWLIDWEYSGMNDPMADFAALFLESDFSDDNIDYVLTEYFDGNIPANAKLKITIYQILWDYLWSLWTVIKEAQGDNFGNYGPMRYHRAIDNLNKIGK